MPPRSMNEPPSVVQVPDWDADGRELRLGEVVVKRFRQPAELQELILTVFQEDNWTRRIDSPIHGDSERQAQDRLRDAVKRLNRQQNPLIRFRLDGRGQGVLWELRLPPPGPSEPRP